MKSSFIKMILAAGFLSGCTMAVHDPEKFDQQAHHAEKIYAKSLDDLYACFMKDIQISPDVTVWKSNAEAHVGETGLYKLSFKAAGRDKTLAQFSHVGTHFEKRGSDFFAKLDQCG